MDVLEGRPVVSFSKWKNHTTFYSTRRLNLRAEVTPKFWASCVHHCSCAKYVQEPVEFGVGVLPKNDPNVSYKYIVKSSGKVYLEVTMKERCGLMFTHYHQVHLRYSEPGSITAGVSSVVLRSSNPSDYC